MKTTKSLLLTFSLLFITLLFLTLPCAADIFHLKDGRVIRGKVVEETEDSYMVQGRRGFQEIMKEEVKKRIRELTKKEEYEEKRKQIHEKDADGHYKLYLWCEESELFDEAKAELQATIEIYPDHGLARKALGQIKYDGIWMTVEEKEAYIKDREKQKISAEAAKARAREEEEKRKEAAKNRKADMSKGTPAADEAITFKAMHGITEYKDMRIRTEEKKFVDQGLMRNSLGEWVTEEEAKKSNDGYYKVMGQWVLEEEADDFHSNWEDAWELYTEHYLFRASISIATLRSIAQKAESLYLRMCQFFGEEPPINDRLKVFILKDIAEYNQFGSQFAGGDVTAFHSSMFGCFYASDHADQPGVLYFESEGWAQAWCYHVQAHQFLDWLVPNITTPAIVEGIATYFERWSLGYFNLGFQKTYNLAQENLKPISEIFDYETIAPEQFELQKPVQYQAGILFYFLYRGGGPEYADKLSKFLSQMKKKTNDKKVFNKIMSMKKLQADFTNFINSG